MAKKFGEEQVHIWRRSYDIQPPALEKMIRAAQVKIRVIIYRSKFNTIY